MKLRTEKNVKENNIFFVEAVPLKCILELVFEALISLTISGGIYICCRCLPILCSKQSHETLPERPVPENCVMYVRHLYLVSPEKQIQAVKAKRTTSVPIR